MDISQITTVSDNSISLPNPPTVYTKEYIDSRCADYTASIANLNAEAQPWFDLQSSPEVTALQPQAQIAQATLSAQPASIA